jgi:hypothetical protein
VGVSCNELMKYTKRESSTELTKTARPMGLSRFACQELRYLSVFWMCGVNADKGNLLTDNGRPR